MQKYVEKMTNSGGRGHEGERLRRGWVARGRSVGWMRSWGGVGKKGGRNGKMRRGGGKGKKGGENWEREEMEGGR